MIKVIENNPVVGQDDRNDRVIGYGDLRWSKIGHEVIVGRVSDLESLGLPVGDALTIGDTFHSTILEIAVGGSETYQFYSKYPWTTLKAAGLLAEHARYDCLLLASTQVLARFKAVGIIERPEHSQEEFYADLTQAEIIAP